MKDKIDPGRWLFFMIFWPVALALEAKHRFDDWRYKSDYHDGLLDQEQLFRLLRKK